MKNTTRIAFNQYKDDQAALHGVASVSESFAVTPNVEQRIVDETQASSDFLKLVNMILVDEKQGKSLGLSSAPNASTTDTTQAERVAKQIIDSHNIDEYDCGKTDFDVATPYALLDMWAHRPEFQQIMARRQVQQMAIDKVTVGFMGTSRAATSSRANNPLGQDVNIGWLQKIRAKTQRYMKDVEFGADKSYKNLDAIAMDAKNSLLDPWHRKSSDLVVICSSAMAMKKYFAIINRAQDNANSEVAERLLREQHFGMLPIVIADQCPDNALLITSLDNLSIYTQRASTRKTIIDNPKRDQIEVYQSQNDAYVIEDFGKVGLVELKVPAPTNG